ncbi:MAG: OmpA family protein [Flavobacteriaceae bacterium]|nr:OmpA family protein [Flavobacteriaceae bacterium]MDG2503455.1 OmpA family protein [Flavobacteriaceae bacterium]|tara:strand:+ start:602 stop:1471 length:870 start_codon:yes stop_codon:yes gene_type:complete
MKTLLLTLLLIPIMGFSQTTISGIVKDKETETLIENAVVVLKPFRIKGGGYYSGKKTEKNGVFKLSTNYNYPMQLITTKKGCETKKIKIKKGNTYVEVIIECDAKSIKEQTSDVDSDGVLDRDDDCVDQAGDSKNKGCPWPDKDNDGVPDDKDNCPEEVGTQENNGCPIVPSKFTEFIESDKNNILFTVSSSQLDSDAKFTLNSVKILLDFYTKTSITIEGYASTDGSIDYNQKLSEERAMEIKNYLVSNNIAPERLNIIGYGESRPVANNSTTYGRAKNRRAQIKINL